MNLKDMTKEQKQYIFLGALGVLAVVSGIVFGLNLGLSSIDKSKSELQEIESKIESAERSLAKQERVRSELAASTVALKEFLRAAPPDQNYYSWVTELIYATARKANLDVDAIDPQSRAGALSKGTGEEQLVLESYTVRISAHGGYETLKTFLQLVEEEHALARIISVDINTGTDPEIHDMQLMLQWPSNLGSVKDAWSTLQDSPVSESVVKAADQDAPERKRPTPPPPRQEAIPAEPQSE